MSATVEVLQAARALIDTPDKWTQGTYDDGEGRRCIVAALDAARNRIPERCAQGTLRATVGGEPLSQWNDAPGRTHAEVMAAFDRAIEAASS
jgi:hypothetical protein